MEAVILVKFHSVANRDNPAGELWINTAMIVAMKEIGTNTVAIESTGGRYYHVQGMLHNVLETLERSGAWPFDSDRGRWGVYDKGGGGQDEASRHPAPMGATTPKTHGIGGESVPKATGPTDKGQGGVAGA